MQAASRVRLAAAAVGAFSALRCTLLTSLDGLSEHEPVETPAVDGGTADARGGGDGSTADARPFCPSVDAAFCADFDEGAYDKGWSDRDETGGGTLGPDTARSVSPPRSLRATLPADPRTSGSKSFQQLNKKLLPPVRPVTVDVDIYLEPPAWSAGQGELSILEVIFRYDSPNVGNYLYIGNGTLVMRTELPSGLVEDTATEQLPTGAWTHLRLETNPSPTGGSFRLYLGSPRKLVLSRAGVAFGNATDVIDFWLGLGRYSGQHPAIDIRYDNVVVTTE